MHTFTPGQEVLFTARGSHITGGTGIFSGTIASVHEDSREVHIHYMLGVKDDWQMTPYSDVLAVHDEKAPHMRLEHFSGHMIDLRVQPVT